MNQPKRKQKFTGKLATPIEGYPARFQLEDIHLNGAESHQKSQKLFAEHTQRIAMEQFIKLPLLADHFNIPTAEPGYLRFILLAIKLAEEIGIPGFQIRGDRRQRGRSRTRGDPNSQEYLYFAIELVKKLGLAKGDADACKIWAECEDPQLARKGRGIDRQKRARTLANLVSKYRPTYSKKLNHPAFALANHFYTAPEFEAIERLVQRANGGKWLDSLT
jgi:hypothetical protein